MQQAPRQRADWQRNIPLNEDKRAAPRFVMLTEQFWLEFGNRGVSLVLPKRATSCMLKLVHQSTLVVSDFNSFDTQNTLKKCNDYFMTLRKYDHAQLMRKLPLTRDPEAPVPKQCRHGRTQAASRDRKSHAIMSISIVVLGRLEGSLMTLRYAALVETGRRERDERDMHGQQGQATMNGISARG